MEDTFGCAGFLRPVFQPPLLPFLFLEGRSGLNAYSGGPTMEQPTAIPTTFTFQDHTIRIVHKRNGSVWFVNADICQALVIADSRKALDVLSPYEMNVIDGSELNDHSELLLSIISESALNKLVHQVSSPKAKEFSEWVKTKIFPQFRLSDIDNQNHLMTEDILFKVQ